MRRGFLTSMLVVIGLYFGLHLVLGSSPVQARVLAEIRAALAKYGIELQMESIEFSALSPKIYLNRVTLTSGPKAPFQLTEPLTIDKIKISFQPFALIYRQISIDELVLFHPKIIIGDASRLYQKIDQMLASKKGVRMQGGAFSLVFRKMGVVDALMAVDASEPQFSFRTRSLSAFLEKNSGDQQSIRVESNNIQLARGPLALELTKVDVDIDATKRSLRVNRAILESQAFALNVKGVSSLPFVKGKGPDSSNVSYELALNLPFLEKLEELRRFESHARAGGRIRTVAGRVVSSGSIRKSGGALSGDGSFRYENLNFDGYRIGRGNLDYRLGGDKLDLTNVVLGYAGGEIRSSKLLLGLHDQFPLTGDVTIHGLAMEGILECVKVTPSPVKMGIDGTASVSGTLYEPFVIRAETQADIHQLVALQHRGKPVTPENTVLTIDKGAINGLLTFTTEKFAFDTKVHALQSELKVDGYVGFGDDPSLVRVRSEGTSLTELGHISDLKVGGLASIAAEVDVRGDDAKIAGSFDVQNGVVADIALGSVKGETFYQNDLLSFENLEIPAIETIHGSGFVDFKPVHTHYKFSGDARRIEVNQAFGVFRNVKLAFETPKGGEVASRFTIEGGHDNHGIEVSASGQAKDFAWYGERWVSANFNLRYRMGDVDLPRLLLIKKSGAVEIKAHFDDEKPRISFLSRGLRLEELDTLRGSLVEGEVLGEIGFTGNKEELFQNGNGELRLTKTAFRGNSLPDTALTLHTVGKELELMGQVLGERLRGRFRRGGGADADELRLSFREFDFTPFVTLLMGKDIPSITQLTATGNWAINGDFSKFNSLKGSGSFTALDLGFKGTPMRNRQTIELELDNGKLRVPRFELDGADSQVSVEVAYEPEKHVTASADAKLDLQMLQPFIPGLDYGTGKVTMALRLSGVPSRYELLGNAQLEGGTFRLNGLLDEFRAAKGQFTISQDRINVDRFETTVNGGTFTVDGDVRINRFQSFTPNLQLHADRVALKLQKALLTRFSGDFTLRGPKQPYALAGNCRIVEGNLTEFSSGGREPAAVAAETPVLTFDLNCEARDHFFVNTEILEGEFHGGFHVLGNTSHIGLLGSAEAIRGTLIFKDTHFTITNSSVKFESASEIAPRFSVSGVARVKEQKLSRINVANAETTDRPQEYEVTLLVYGTPTDYKLRLSSSPPLPENDIISLLVLGVTSHGGEGNYADLGSALVGQIPLQSKLQNEFGLDIRIKSQAPTELQQLYQQQQSSSTSTSSIAGRADITVPSVQIQKEISRKTRVSFSNTLEATPTRELKLEQLLDENLSVNATVEQAPVDPAKPAIQSYGLDFRYRFNFE